MERSNDEVFHRSVLVVVSDPGWRGTLERACRTAGVRVRATSTLAEVERWPEGEIVIADAAHVTPIWKTVGAVEVIALVNNAEEGYVALDEGASTWLPTDSSAAEVTAAVRSLVLESGAQLNLPSASRGTASDGSKVAESVGALEDFFSESMPSDSLKPNLHSSSVLSDNRGHRVPDLSIPWLDQNDSTITVRPAKDRRRSAPERRFRLSARAYALVALAAVLGGGACFALFRDLVPLRGARTAAVLRAPSAQVATTAETGKAGGAVPSAPAPSPPAPMPPAEARTSQDLTGWWAMTNQVQASGYRPYQGLRLGYRLQLRQDGTRISGDGHKWLENGRAIPRANRTPISVSGVMEGRRMALTFSERGRRRQSRGTFDLELVSDGVLRGKFESDAARSRGSSVAERMRN